MSYSVYLNKNGVTVTVPNHKAGPTYVLDGTRSAEMDVTYNYSKVYSEFPSPIEEGARFNLRDFSGMSALASIPILDDMINVLGNEPDDDYWKPTNGNAGNALAIMLYWARLHPYAVWSVN